MWVGGLKVTDWGNICIKLLRQKYRPMWQESRQTSLSEYKGPPDLCSYWSLQCHFGMSKTYSTILPIWAIPNPDQVEASYVPTVLTCKRPHRVTISVRLLSCNLEGFCWDFLPLSQWPETLLVHRSGQHLQIFLIIALQHFQLISVTH